MYIIELYLSRILFLLLFELDHSSFMLIDHEPDLGLNSNMLAHVSLEGEKCSL